MNKVDVMRSGLCLIAIVLVLGSTDRVSAKQVPDPEEWRLVSVPDVWKQPPIVGSTTGTGSGRVGFAWYRCAVVVPEGWETDQLQLSVEPVDDARSTFVNGIQVGATGTFPPRYRSGLGDQGRFAIPPGLIRAGESNLIAIRVYYNDGRSNFSVAAPALFDPENRVGIKLEGSWQYRPGDDLDWAIAREQPIDSEVVYDQVEEIGQIDHFLQARRGDSAPLSPDAALERFEVADDLAIDLVLAEPIIAQPLQISFDTKGRLWLVEYRQYPDPAGINPVSRDKYLRTVYDGIPAPPPEGPNGDDRISIHQDTDGDGSFDRHSIFLDDLNLATSIAVDRDGVWVLNPPYLLFYPDRDQDDRPDGDPEVHLEGFGLEDSHSICNSLCWGPDGWLYGAQGSTVTGRVRRPGDPEESIVHSMGQLIWRYHPTTHCYEIFAEGGGNTFGVEIDAKGRLYSGHNGGDTRGFHYVQGGYYQKGFTKHGALSNPYAFGYFPSMTHHSVPRFTHSLVINDAAALPARYQGDLFGVEPLQGQVVWSTIESEGSTMQTRDLGRPVVTDDPWFRPVHMTLGPDGALYLADFYEQRIDHSSHYAGRIDKSNGRVYRIRNRSGLQPIKSTADLSIDSLLNKLHNSNREVRRSALRSLGSLGAELQKSEASAQVYKFLSQRQVGQASLDYLFAANRLGVFENDQAVIDLLDHPDPYVRSWSIRLAADDREVSPQVSARLRSLALDEAEVSVRSQLASSARRLNPEDGLPILRGLLTRQEDLQDPHLPLLVWWGLESFIDFAPDEVLALFENPSFQEEPLVAEVIASRLMKRFAKAGSRTDLARSASLIESAGSDAYKARLVAAFEEATIGRFPNAIPERLAAAILEAGGGSLSFRVRTDVPGALEEARRLVADPAIDSERRLELIETLAEVNDSGAVPALLGVASTGGSPRLRASAFLALRVFPRPEITEETIRLHNGLPDEVRDAAQELLVSRPDRADAFLKAIRTGGIEENLVPESIARKILLFNDEALDRQVRALWGTLEGATSREMRFRIEQLKAVLAEASGNPYQGKYLYNDRCSRCHRLFDEGGDVGPDLTSYQRSELDSMLLAIVNPSAEVREGYETYAVALFDGRVATGFLADRDNQVMILRGPDGRNQTIRLDDADAIRQIPESVMPTGLLDGLSDQEIRDLFAYLRSTQPLNN